MPDAQCVSLLLVVDRELTCRQARDSIQPKRRTCGIILLRQASVWSARILEARVLNAGVLNAGVLEARVRERPSFEGPCFKRRGLLV